MKMNDFICSCFFMDGEVIDRIMDDFDIDCDENDILDILKNKDADELKCVGLDLLYMVFGKIISKYPELERDKLDYDFSSPSYPDFYYDGRLFHTKEELEEILDEADSSTSDDNDDEI